MPTDLPIRELFHRCAENTRDETSWEEFVRRFNVILARSIAVAWRRRRGGEFIPRDLAPELLNDVYTAILKEECRVLRQFRGTTEAEAQAYIAHIAINQTRDHMRRLEAEKRLAETVSLDELLADNDGEQGCHQKNGHRKIQLSEHELEEILRRLMTGPHACRDILLLQLHLQYGYTAQEIGEMRLCDLKATSVANLLVERKKQLRNFLLEHQ
ncbi:MAG: RNA polymerase sigma factor [Blastocatellia bacterium]